MYLFEADAYRCPPGELLRYCFTAEERGQRLRRYWRNACRTCAPKGRCTTGKQRRITRREHEDVLEAVQRRLDENPNAMRQRLETVEHPFGTIKMRMGAPDFLMKRLPNVAMEMVNLAGAPRRLARWRAALCCAVQSRDDPARYTMPLFVRSGESDGRPLTPLPCCTGTDSIETLVDGRRDA